MKSLLMAASLSAGRYPLNILQDIVSQITFRNNVAVDERTKQQLSLSGAAAAPFVENGQLVVMNQSASRYLFQIPYFGAGDFTYEIMFRQTSVISGEALLLPSQWHNGAISNPDNRLLISVRPNGLLRVQLARGNTGTSVYGDSAPNTILLNNDYHLVVERYNGVIKAFVNGVEVLSFAHALPLYGETNNRLYNYYNGTGYASYRWWNFRLAKRAMYRHSVTVPVSLPRI
jgi:hypothetical protein